MLLPIFLQVISFVFLYSFLTFCYSVISFTVFALPTMMNSTSLLEDMSFRITMIWSWFLLLIHINLSCCLSEYFNFFWDFVFFSGSTTERHSKAKLQDSSTASSEKTPPRNSKTKFGINCKADASLSNKLKSFSFIDLKNATKNFPPENFLGEGGFGCVFKGWIDENTLAATKPGSGMVVAIKKLKPESCQGHKEWLVCSSITTTATFWL